LIGLAAASAAAGAAGIGEVTIPNYDGKTFHKGATGVAGNDSEGGSGNVTTLSRYGIWKNTAAITRVTIGVVTAGKKFKAGSRCTIYGLA
jgi:hypothetical protein